MAFDFLGLSSYLYFVYSNVMKSKVLLVLMNLFLMNLFFSLSSSSKLDDNIFRISREADIWKSNWE